MLKFSKYLAYIFVFIVLSFFLPGRPAKAQTAEDLFKSSLDQTSQEIGYNDASKLNQPLTQTIGEFIQILLLFLGIIFLLLIIYGGYIWMLARGNEEEVKRAQKIIEESIIGLLIVLGSYAISYYVIDIILYPSV